MPGPMRKVALTVVIVTHNGWSLTQRCLQSLGHQEAIQIRILVVDNASDDETPTLLARDFPEVEVIRLSTNSGFSVANNRAISVADSEYVLLLNPDTEVPPGTLAKCVDVIERHSEVALLGCKLITPSGELDHACKRAFPTPRNALAYFLGGRFSWILGSGRSAYTANHLPDGEWAYVDAINGAFMLARMSAVREVGLLDERFWMYGEDLDWCFRFWQSG